MAASTVAIAPDPTLSNTIINPLTVPVQDPLRKLVHIELFFNGPLDLINEPKWLAAVLDIRRTIAADPNQGIRGLYIIDPGSPNYDRRWPNLGPSERTQDAAHRQQISEARYKKWRTVMQMYKKARTEGRLDLITPPPSVFAAIAASPNTVTHINLYLNGDTRDITIFNDGRWDRLREDLLRTLALDPSNSSKGVYIIDPGAEDFNSKWPNLGPTERQLPSASNKATLSTIRLNDWRAEEQLIKALMQTVITPDGVVTGPQAGLINDWSGV